jgi:DNA-directed RNA polymerase specialized sigma24 family protein
VEGHARRTPRVPSRQDFDLLLRALDPERERAGERYEAIRGRLLRFFLSRNAPQPEELADETFDRVCRKLAQGEVIRAADAGLYFLGVARNVAREAWHQQAKRQQGGFPQEALLRPAAVEPGDEQALACLERCLATLDAASRKDLLRYHHVRPGTSLEDQRRALAKRLGLGANALRIRMHRLRVRLRECLSACLDAGETSAPSTPQPSEGSNAGADA